MELMSLVLCALVLLPQALGKSSRKFVTGSDLDTQFLKNQKQLNDETFFVHFNKTSNFNRVSDLQSVFMDPECKECHNCMEQAIKAHKVHSHMNTETKVNDVPNEIDNHVESTTSRNKRNLVPDLQLNVVKKAKKSKGKKNKNKTFSVTKYSDEGKIYALKVKEATPLTSDQQNQTKASVTKCQMYRVKEYFSCDSPDADLILKEAKQKINKTSIKEKGKKEINLPVENKEKDRIIAPMFAKRHADESQISENFMPSIEEIY
ncbi:uncharacterized protein [Epargyreus clarus]|uniref:uncharacterized protein n=1 Tax=Epargyreus clarus TaxID=520877 RepID=UPI003C2DB1BE